MNYRSIVLSFLLLTGLALSAQDRFPPEPDPPRLVNDRAGILEPAQRQQLEQKLTRYADTTSTEIAVVILNSIGGEDPNLYAAELGEKWGVGRKGKDNGLVFLVAVEDRKMAIQNGYGLEDKLTDAATKVIIDRYITPEFKKGNFYEGIHRGTDQIILLLAGKFTGSGNRADNKQIYPIFGVLLLIGLLMFFVGRRRGHHGHHRGMGGGYWIGGMGAGMGRPSGGFGGGGGGFGGFGGGSFGGGGASGSW